MPAAAIITIPVTTNAKQAAVDLSKLDTTLDNLDSTLKDINKNLEKTSKENKKTANSFSKFKRAIVASGILLLGKKLINLASDAEETQNKFNVVFKDVPEQARRAAEGLASGFAIAKDEAQKLLSDTGDLLTGFGFTGKEALDLSEKVNTLAGDLASFTNIEGGAERASKALTSALFGEREAAKQLGIVIREEDIQARLAAKGLDKLTGSALMQAKANETLNIAVEQSQNAIGDFARSSDSFANVSKRLNANLRDAAVEAGKQLVPAMKELAIFFSEATTEGSNLNEFFKVVAQSITVVIKAVTNLMRALGSIATEGPIKEEWINTKMAERTAKNAKSVIDSLGGMDEAQKLAANGNIFAKAALDNYELAMRTAPKSIQDLALAAVKASEDQKKLENTTKASTKATIIDKKAQQEWTKARMAALAIVSKGEGVEAAKAQMELLRRQQEEQTKIVEAAGLSAASLDQFYQKKRETQLQNFLQKSISDESMGFSDRQAVLQSNYETLLETENLSYEERLAAQQAYTEASNALEQQRMQTIAQGVNDFATFGNEIVGIGQAYSNLRQAQIKQEIEDLRARGASEEEIAKKEKELQRKAAEDNKKIQLASAFINVAQGVTRALAAFPPPASYILAALTATKGALEIAAIQATPIPGAQFGGDFMVPPGNEADSGLLNVNQGEKISVTPVRETGGSSEFGTIMIGDQAFDAYLTKSMQRIFNEGKIQIRRKGTVKVA